MTRTYFVIGVALIAGVLAATATASPCVDKT